MAAFPTLAAGLEATIAGARSPRERTIASEALFEALYQPVFALCLHLTGRVADADDAVQETFLSVHRALAGFRGEAKLTTWVYRVAVREAVRVRARRRDTEPLDLDLPGPSSEQSLEARDLARRVLQAIDRLPLDQRVVLSLFAIEGLGHDTIAEILNVPVGTVWSRLSAARRALTAMTGKG